MAEKTRQWKGTTGGYAFGWKALKAMFSVVDVRVGYFVLFFVVPFYMLKNHREYLAIYRYFRKQHRYPALKSFYKTYVNHLLFGRMILDRIAVYAGRKTFRMENADNRIFMQALEEQGGCIMAGSHVGNPELCGYLLKQDRKRINSLIFGGEAKEVQKNRLAMLDGNSVRVIPVSDDMSHIFMINEALTNGEMVSIFCDRSFGSNKTVECDFLNGKADFPTGAFVLALQFNVPVISMFVLKITASLYRIHVEPVPVPTEGDKHRQINEMTRSFVGILEGIVKKYPEQWFNFYNFWKDENVSRSYE